HCKHDSSICSSLIPPEIFFSYHSINYLMLIYTKVQNHRGESYRRFSSTAVWQNGGFNAKFNGSSSIELLCKTEHLCFDFRHFAKLQNDVTKSLRASVTSPGGFAVRSPFRDFVHLKVLQNAKHFAKPPGVSGNYSKAHQFRNKN